MYRQFFSFEKLAQLVKEKDEAETRLQQQIQVVADINKNQPATLTSFTTDDQWNEYLQSNNDFIAFRKPEDVKQIELEKLFDLKTKELLAFIPRSNTWFRLPGTNHWIAKSAHAINLDANKNIHSLVTLLDEVYRACNAKLVYAHDKQEHELPGLPEIN